MFLVPTGAQRGYSRDHRPDRWLAEPPQHKHGRHLRPCDALLSDGRQPLALMRGVARTFRPPERSSTNIIETEIKLTAGSRAVGEASFPLDPGRIHDNFPGACLLGQSSREILRCSVPALDTELSQAGPHFRGDNRVIDCAVQLFDDC